jgi:hypothetical protein
MGRERVAVTVGAMALLSGCGGDGGTLSADEFRDRAEAICREIEEVDVRPPADFNDLGRYADEFIDKTEESSEALHALDPPEEFQARWQQYLELVDELDALFAGIRADIDGATRTEVVALFREFDADLQELTQRGHAIERELGLDECVD